MYHVYIVHCEDDYLYTGITGNLEKRLIQHSQGLSRLTKNRGKISLVFSERYSTRIEAAKREKEIKGWSRVKKMKLIDSLH
jgi:putative endonuclease